MRTFENHCVRLHKRSIFPRKKKKQISILIEMLLQMFEDLPNIARLLSVGQVSLIGGCRSRSS